MKTERNWQIPLGIALIIALGVGLYFCWPSDQGNQSVVSNAPAPAKAPVRETFASTPNAPVAKPSASAPQTSQTPSSAIQVGSVSIANKVKRPVSIVGGQQAAYPGLYTDARVMVGGKSYDLSPNQLGDFQRVYIDPKAKVSVQVNYPEGQKGDPIALEVEDGGQLSNKTMGSVIKLDDQNTAQFQFLAGDQEGIYRIVLRNGADVKTVNLWVGQEAAAN